MRSRRRLIKATAFAAVFAVLVGACTQNRVEESTTTAATPTTIGAPSVPNAPPPPPAPIAVLVRRPASLSESLLGATVDLGVHVLAENPIARIELWDGDELVAETITEGTNDEEKALMSWIPATTGLHVALARAIDINGLTAQAFPVWFRVVEGDMPPAPTAGLDRPRPVRSAAGGLFLAAPAGLAALPEAPGIAVDAGDCSATVDVGAASGASGIALWGAILGGRGFVPMAVLGGRGGKLRIPATGLPQIVYTEPYNEAGSVPSVPAWIPAVDGCSDGDMNGKLSGDIHFEGGFLVTGTGVDRVYLYGSRDGSVWSRLPGTDHSFVYPGPSGFDFSNILPDPGPDKILQVEAWGWRGNELLWLGRAEYAPTAPPANAPPPMLGTGSFAMVHPASSLMWVEKPASVAPDVEAVLTTGGALCTYVATSSGGAIALFKNCDQSIHPAKTLRLSSLPPTADGAIWQVSSLPPPAGPSLDFLGMLAFDSAPEGDFTIDLAKILDPPPNANTAGDPTQSKYQNLQQVAMGGGAQPSGSGQTFYAPPNPVLPSGLKPTALFVRVVPTKGGQPLEGVSNVVKFDLVHEPPLEVFVLTGDYTAQAEFTEPGQPNEKWLRCMRIIDNPFPGDLNLPPSLTPDWVAENNFNIYSQSEIWYGAFPTAPDGGTLCGFKPEADPPGKSIFEYIVDAINFVGYVWDMFVMLYDMAKSAIVSALLIITQCDQFASKEACETIANTGLHLALTAIGIPPTLPSFKEATEALKGDLVSYLVSEALKSGPCGTLETLCDEIAEEMLETMVNQIQQQVNQAATKAIVNQGYVFALHPGITAIPEPAGTLHGATIRLTLTRPAFGLAPTSCYYVASVQGQVQHEWYDWDLEESRNEVVTGEPFAHATGSIDMSAVAPGQSKTKLIEVHEWVPWYLPGHDNSDWQADKFDPEGWIFFKPGAVMTVTIESSCFETISKSFVQDGQKHEPADIPTS